MVICEYVMSKIGMNYNEHHEHKSVGDSTTNLALEYDALVFPDPFWNMVFIEGLALAVLLLSFCQEYVSWNTLSILGYNLPTYVFIIYPTTEEQHHNLSASDNKGNGWQFWKKSILVKNESVNFELILNTFHLAVI